jgi:hypothetical protein
MSWGMSAADAILAINGHTVPPFVMIRPNGSYQFYGRGRLIRVENERLAIVRPDRHNRDERLRLADLKLKYSENAKFRKPDAVVANDPGVLVGVVKPGQKYAYGPARVISAALEAADDLAEAAGLEPTRDPVAMDLGRVCERPSGPSEPSFAIGSAPSDGPTLFEPPAAQAEPAAPDDVTSVPAEPPAKTQRTPRGTGDTWLGHYCIWRRDTGAVWCGRWASWRSPVDAFGTSRKTGLRRIATYPVQHVHRTKTCLATRQAIDPDVLVVEMVEKVMERLTDPRPQAAPLATTAPEAPTPAPAAQRPANKPDGGSADALLATMAEWAERIRQAQAQAEGIRAEWVSGKAALAEAETRLGHLERDLTTAERALEDIQAEAVQAISKATAGA